MSDPTFSQYSYRFRDDTYGESTDNGWLAAVDTSYSGVSLDTTYRVRFVIWETNSKNGTNTRWRLEFRHVEGDNAWEPCTTTADAVRPAASSNLTEDGDATNLSAAMNNPGTGTYLTTNLGIDDTDGTTGNLTTFAKDDFHHVEFAFQIRSAVVSAGDQVDFRIVETDGDYTVTSYPATAANLVVSSTPAAQSLTAPVISGGATTVTPSMSVGAVSLTAPIVVGGATTVTPILYPGVVSLTAPVTSGAATTVTPTMEGGPTAIDAPIVSGAATVVAPSLTGGPASITAPIVVGGATVVTPTMELSGGPQSLTAPVVVGGATTVAPSMAVGAVSLTAPIVVGGATTVTPELLIPQVHWEMDEGSGTQITDLYNSIVATRVGTEKWVDGKIGSDAIHVSTASDGHYEAAIERALKPTTEFTLTLWFQSKSNPGSIATIAGVKYDAGQHAFGIFHPGTLVAIAAHVNTTSGAANTGNTAAVDLDKWYFAVLRWKSGTSVNLRVYREDGTTHGNVSGLTRTGTVLFHASDFPFVIGGNGITTSKVNDYIDDVRLYHRRLSDAEVEALIPPMMDAPIVVGGATVVTPSMSVGAVSLDAPIVVGGATVVTPSLVGGATSLDAPLVTGGATTVTPSMTGGAASLDAPLVVGGATVVTPTMSLGGSPQSLTAPVVVGGATTVTPSLVGGATSLDAPIVVGGATVVTPTMSLSGAPQSLTAPVVVGGATVVAPSLVGGATSLNAPLVVAGATVVTPSMEAGLVMTAPIVVGGATTVTPSLVGGATSLDAPIVTGGATVVTPSMTVGAVVLDAPLVVAGATVVTPSMEAGLVMTAPIVVGGASVVTPSLGAGAVALTAPIVVAGATVVTPTMTAPGAAQSLTAPLVVAGATVVQPWMLLSTEIVYTEFTVLDQCITGFVAIEEPADFTALDECEATFEALEENE